MQKQLDKYLEIQVEDNKIAERLSVIGLIPLAELSDEIRAEQLTLRQRVQG